MFSYLEQEIDNNGGRKANQLPPRQFLAKYLPKFGAMDGGNYYCLYNEYWEEYNPCQNLGSFVGAYYGLEDFWFSDYETVDAYGTAEGLWHDEFGTDFPQGY
jgi:hypothetical protein